MGKGAQGPRIRDTGPRSKRPHSGILPLAGLQPGGLNLIMILGPSPLPHGSLSPMLSLIGYRATGKTTLARLLAERLGWPWTDADVEIERRRGKSHRPHFRGGRRSGLS